MSNIYNMNHSEAATNWNNDQAPRFRNNYDNMPYLINYPMMFPVANTMMMNPAPITIAHPTEPSNFDSNSSGLTSPTNLETPKQSFTVDHWQNIVSRYDGNSDERPNCGKLRDDVYFTHRSGEAYLLFEKKSDYINHFINYYFSDRNLQKDKKLVDLMDAKYAVPLSALIKFPKLNQVETSVDDVVKALQNNTFLCLTEHGTNNEKAIKRRDKGSLNDGTNRSASASNYDTGYSTNSNSSLSTGRLSSELGSAGDIQNSYMKNQVFDANDIYHQHSQLGQQSSTQQGNPQLSFVYLTPSVTAAQVPSQSGPTHAAAPAGYPFTYQTSHLAAGTAVTHNPHQSQMHHNHHPHHQQLQPQTALHQSHHHHHPQFHVAPSHVSNAPNVAPHPNNYFPLGMVPFSIMDNSNPAATNPLSFFQFHPQPVGGTVNNSIQQSSTPYSIISNGGKYYSSNANTNSPSTINGNINVCIATPTGIVNNNNSTTSSIATSAATAISSSYSNVMSSSTSASVTSSNSNINQQSPTTGSNVSNSNNNQVISENTSNSK